MKNSMIPQMNEPLFPANRKKAFDELIAMNDLAEKEHRPLFSDFNDKEMMYYFLYAKSNMNQEANRTDITIKEYERELEMMVRQLIEYGADMGLDLDQIIDGSLFKSMGNRHLRRYQVWIANESPYVRKKGAYSAATMERKTVIWKSFFHFLHKTGYIQQPLHEGLLSATVRKDDRPNRDLGPGEVIQLLDYFNKVKHPIVFSMIHTMVATGMRNQEFCLLKESDIKYDSILGEYFLMVTGKGNKRREIPIKPKLMDSIINYRRARMLPADFPNNNHQPLFPTSTGRAFSPSYLAQYLGRAIEQSELPFLKHRESRVTAHVFRHSFAIISYLNGVDIYGIMRSLGHEKIDTTMVYLQKVMNREQHAIHRWKEGALGTYI